MIICSCASQLLFHYLTCDWRAPITTAHFWEAPIPHFILTQHFDSCFNFHQPHSVYSYSHVFSSHVNSFRITPSAAWFHFKLSFYRLIFSCSWHILLMSILDRQHDTFALIYTARRNMLCLTMQYKPMQCTYICVVPVHSSQRSKGHQWCCDVSASYCTSIISLIDFVLPVLYLFNNLYSDVCNRIPSSRRWTLVFRYVSVSNQVNMASLFHGHLRL